MVDAIQGKNHDHDEITVIFRDLFHDFQVDQEKNFDKRVDDRIIRKASQWLVAGIIAYAVPAAVLIYQLGGINTNLDLALEAQRLNTQSLEARGGWMNDQEQFNCEIRRILIDQDPTNSALLPHCAFASGKDRTDSRR